MKRIGSFFFFILLILNFSTSFAQQGHGSIQSHQAAEATYQIETEEGMLQLSWYTPAIVRVDHLPAGTGSRDSSYSVIQQPDAEVSYSLSESGELLEFTGEEITVQVTKSDGQVKFFDESGNELLSEAPAGGFSVDEGKPQAEFTLEENLSFYGTGMRGVGLDLRGKELEVYNTQAYGYTDAVETMNVNIPMTTTNAGYSLFFDNRWRSYFDFGYHQDDRFSFRSEGGTMSYYFIKGEEIADQLRRYSWLTGRQPIPPKWSLGYIQSKFGYETEQQARGVVDTLRNKDFPTDVLVLDLQWNEHMGDLSWDRDAFPEPYRMISDFKDNGINTVLISQPYMVEFSRNFPPADSLGYLVMNEEGDTYRMEEWWSCDGECDGVLLDFTNPDTRDWWWSLHPDFMQNDTANVSGYWTDLGEPERHHEDMVHHEGVVEEVHNTYNLKWAQLLFEGHREMRPNERIFNLSRSGFAGIQRYGTVPWSGDVSRTFSALEVQPRMMLNQSMAGIPWHHSDLGGFTGDECNAELYTRWIQHGIFSPIARAHGNDQCPTEPWGFGSTTESINRDYIKKRYAFMPYLYTMAWQSWAEGMPVTRPLFFEDPDDDRLSDEGDVYFFGDDIIVAPVLEEGQRRKEVYLPEGRWIDYHTGRLYQGGRDYEVYAPLDRMPMFIRAGAIIPKQKVEDHTSSTPPDTLKLALYPDAGQDGSFTLYEDDGATLDYKDGAYATTDFEQRKFFYENQQITEVEIGRKHGEFDGALDERVYLAKLRNQRAAPEEVYIEGEPVTRYDSLDALRTSETGFYFDRREQTIYVQLTTPTDTDSRLQIIR